MGTYKVKSQHDITDLVWKNIFFSLCNTTGACIHQAEREQKKALIWRPVDLFFIIYLVAAMGFSLFRGLVRLTPTKMKYIKKYQGLTIQ